MNKFIIIKARNIELYERAKARLASDALGLLPFHPRRIRIREFERSLVLFANFEIATTGGMTKHYVHTSEQATFAFDGLPYSPLIDPLSNWAQQINREWNSDQRMIEHLFGTWALARFDENVGARLLSDFSGMTPLFYWQDADYLAVSPRQMLLSGICGDSEYDLQAMAWLTGQANLIGDSTAWKNVRHLPPQWTMTFNAVPSDLSFEFIQREIWSEEIDSEPDDAQMARIMDSMIAQCDALARLPVPPIRLDITGGLDSRLVAALASASSLKDRVEYMQTSGPENGHDLQVGRAIAESLGIRHVHNLPGTSTTAPEDVLRGIRASVFRYEASICPSDGFVGAAQRSKVVLTGSAGEIYRRNCKPHMKVNLTSEGELHELFANYHQITDPLAVESVRVASAQREEMQRLAVGFHRAGVAVNDVTDVFYMRYRLPLWNGMMMNNIFGSTRIYPLVNFLAAKYAFSRGYKARVNDRIHFELMLKLNPKLCAMPFLSFAWPGEYRDYAAKRGVEVAAAPFPVTGGRALGSHNRHHTMAAEGWPLAKSYVLDPSGSALWDVIDRNRVEKVFAEGSKGFTSVTHIKQIFALMGMQAAVCGDGIRALDGSPGVPPILDGFTANEIFRSPVPA